MAYTLDFRINGADGRPLQSISDVIREMGIRTHASSGELRLLESVMKGNATAGLSLRDSIKLVSESTDAFQKNIRSAAKELLAHTEGANVAGRAVRNLATEHERAASRIEQAMGRIGGRLAGSSMGIPGGGFMGGQFAGALGLGAGFGAGAAGLFAAVDIARHVTELAKQAEQWKINGAAIGLTAQQMELLDRVSERTGVKLDGVAKSLSGMREKLIDGGSAADKIRSNFENLGISASTAFEDPLHAIDGIVHALVQIKDPLERSQRGFELLGESGRQVAALADNWDKLQQRASRGLISAEGQDKLDKTRQSMQDLHEAMQKVWELAATPLTFIIDIVSGKGLPGPNTGPAQMMAGSGLAEQMLRRWNPGLFQTQPFVGPQMSKDMLAEPGVEASQLGDASAFLKNYRVQQYDAIDQRTGTASNPYAGRLKSVADQLSNLRGKDLSPADYERQKRSLLGQQSSLEEQQRRFTSRRGQVEELRRMTGPTTDQDANRLFLELPKRFELATDSPEYKAWYQTLQAGSIKNFGESGARMFKGETLDQLTGKMHMPLTGADRLFSGDISRTDKEAQETLRSATARIRASQSADLAGLGYDAAVGSGGIGMLSAMGRLTPAQQSQLEYSQQVSQIRGQYGIKSQAIGSELAGIGGNEPAAQLERQSKLDELNTLKIDADTKLIEATNKLNESFATTARKMDEDFSNSIIGILMGAQKGGGKGARSAAISMGEGLETTMLKNLMGPQMLGIKAPTLASGGFLGNLLQGTPFGPRGDPGERTAVATEGILKVMTGQPVAGISGAAMSIPGIGGGGSWLGSLFGGGGFSIPGLTSNGGAFESGGGRAGLGGLGLTPGRLGGIFTGSANTNSIGLSDANGNPAPSLQMSGSDRIGTAATAAVAAMGVFQGIQTASRGGAKSVTAGIGEGLMAASVFTGPAMPFVAAVGAAVSMVSMILPDPKVQRAMQISRNMFTQQYLAPSAQNVSMSGNGGLSDVDQFGNVRTSNISPYPIVSNSYLDVPRRIVVPGHPISTFGGFQNVTGAQVPQPIVIHVNAMDSKSIIDRSGDIAAALHRAILAGHEPLVHALGQQLGTR